MTLRLQRIVSIIMMAMMLGSALASVMAISNAKAQSIGTKDLGIEYPKSIGLGTQDVRTTASQIIKVALGLLGVVAVVIILIGGFTWMTAGGNTEKVDEAKKWIFSGIIGLAIILSAYAIAFFVLKQLTIATTGGDVNPITP